MPIAEKPHIENILDQRVSKKTKRKNDYEYLVKWKDLTAEDAIWITDTDIQKHVMTMQELMERSP
jgi:hypothetical protein